MRKLKIYLDTSVINFLFADDAPHFKIIYEGGTVDGTLQKKRRKRSHAFGNKNYQNGTWSV